MSCKNHIIGVCAGANIVSLDAPAVKKFLSNLKVFTTSKKQVNHPGFMLLAKCCTECGEAIDYKNYKAQWDELIETVIIRKNEADEPVAAKPDKLSGTLHNSDGTDAKSSSFRPSAARLRAIAIASEATLLESDNGENFEQNSDTNAFICKRCDSSNTDVVGSDAVKEDVLSPIHGHVEETIKEVIVNLECNECRNTGYALV
jgi:hypothetical protein